MSRFQMSRFQREIIILNIAVIKSREPIMTKAIPIFLMYASDLVKIIFSYQYPLFTKYRSPITMKRSETTVIIIPRIKSGEIMNLVLSY